MREREAAAGKSSQPEKQSTQVAGRKHLAVQLNNEGAFLRSARLRPHADSLLYIYARSQLLFPISKQHSPGFAGLHSTFKLFTHCATADAARKYQHVNLCGLMSMLGQVSCTPPVLPTHTRSTTARFISRNTHLFRFSFATFAQSDSLQVASNLNSFNYLTDC